MRTETGFNADPDPALYLSADPDPDPESQTNADPCGSWLNKSLFGSQETRFIVKFWSIPMLLDPDPQYRYRSDPDPQPW
jgi:hypothetical protein